MKNNTINIDLLFPPVFDNSMPYLANYLLKSYVQINSNYKVNCIDFNSLFFESVCKDIPIKSYQNKIHDFLTNDDNIRSLNLYFEYIESIETKLDSIAQSNLKASLRKLKTPNGFSNTESLIKDLKLNSKYHEIINKIIKQNITSTSKAVGLSIAVEDQLYFSFYICKVIRTLFPNKKIILGGNIPTRLYEELKKSELAVYFDFIVRNEGETAVVEILDYLYNDEKNQIIHDKVYSTLKIPIENKLENKKSEVEKIKNKTTPQFPLNGFYFSPEKVIPIISSRRCYWAKCDFCSIFSTWDPTFRKRTMYDFIEDIKFYISQGFQNFRIVDEDFPPRSAQQFAEEIINNGLNITYQFYSRFEKIFLDEDFCTILYNSGCRQIFFGLENIGIKTSLLVNKGAFYTRDNVEKVLRNTSKAGILNYLFILTGIPNAPQSEEQETTEFVVENYDIHRVSMGAYVVDKLSPIHLDEKSRNKFDINIFSVGDLTTELGYKHSKGESKDSAILRTKGYIQTIYSKRPDLALNSILDEESRLIFCKHLGNKFAIKYFRDKTDMTKRIVEVAISKTMDLKVTKILS